MSIHEECGVFGLFSEKPVNAAEICYFGLFALQHRGQESCGIVVNEDGLFVSHKDLGLVSEVFSKETLLSFPKGKMAVSHTRYGTTGAANRNNCQPIVVNHQKGRMAVAHNGNTEQQPQGDTPRQCKILCPLGGASHSILACSIHSLEGHRPCILEQSMVRHASGRISFGKEDGS